MVKKQPENSPMMLCQIYTLGYSFIRGPKIEYCQSIKAVSQQQNKFGRGANTTPPIAHIAGSSNLLSL